MHIVLGVTGGIAAYKAAELARLLVQQGHTVQVVMTEAAQEFVRPLTFAALTARKVITAMFDTEGAIEHVALAQETAAAVIAPATADVMARMAHGIADDFLTTFYLAYTGPVVIAPAMNTNMWEHAATRANLETLRGRGHTIVEPESGELACGTVGPGRLASIERIAAAVEQVLHPRRDLAGEKILITAGPTQEPIDPVRYLSNRSSGRMGYALAEAAVARGAGVVLISGPVSLAAPRGVSLVSVRTAFQMREAVFAHLEGADMVIMAAAVADYHVSHPPARKIKKTAARLSLELDPTPDILAELGRKKGGWLLIGFAAETENVEAEARRKLEIKNCDMVVGNQVGGETGFESDENEAVLALATGGFVSVPRAPKRQIADAILDQALKLRLALHAHGR
jgi:phosphopantothenoylcysteine decarboxylase/phosphopantothenate--cysteine ligase